jgi:hypothetical protein
VQLRILVLPIRPLRKNKNGRKEGGRAWTIAKERAMVQGPFIHLSFLLLT